jgi:hypothetical protein
MGVSYHPTPEWEAENKELISYVAEFYKTSPENARHLVISTPLAERECNLKFQQEMLARTPRDPDFEHLQNLLRNKK